ncbi:GNAT family N-acetyltransferase [Lentibacillus kimchii]
MTHDLSFIPDHTLPEGYQFQFFSDFDDRNHWAEIETAANEFQIEASALRRFQNECEPHLDEVRKRLIFLLNPNGNYAGTTMAWFNAYNHQTIGRLHWTAIHPAYQGQKLAKPLIAKAMNVLAQHHNQAYLKTQPHNLAAIHNYLHFGFQPLLIDEASKQTWNHVYAKLSDT